MRLDAFDYDLPQHLIAQYPVEPRDASRLMVLSDPLEHRRFRDLVDYLHPGDLLILNDTRVVAARLRGRRAQTGGRWEGLFVRETAPGEWELLTHMKGKPRPGEILLAEPPSCSEPNSAGATEPLPLLLLRKEGGRWLVRPQRTGQAAELLAQFGQVPIPPYIRDGRADALDTPRYQTVYARRDGAVAAPTAGLHFTEELFAALEAKGVHWAFVTLHVGPGTFQPVQVEEVTQHRVEPEWGELPESTAQAIAACRSAGKRVIAVGTTSTRVLEAAAGQTWSGFADLTILPGYRFQVVDALITNFHLPRSSLLLLVSAFAGYERIRAAYAEAVRLAYRFYSYGDAMFLPARQET
jgi:S-adenosylmethionine:tRNA ribosyltransferase-isomerase